MAPGRQAHERRQLSYLMIPGIRMAVNDRLVLALIEQRIRLLQGETEAIRRAPGDAVRLGEDGRWNASGFAAAGLEA